MKVDELRSSGTVTGTTFSGNLSGGSVSATTGTFSGAVYYNEWLRNNGTSASGLYWHNSSNPGWKWHIYPETQADMTFRTGSGNGGIKGTVSNATARGYIHWTTSNEIGFLTSGRSWTLRCDNNKNVQIYGTVTAPTFSGTATVANSTNGNGKIVVQNGTNGGNTRGIWMWTATDSNWGIYMGQSGSGRSLAGGTASAFQTVTSHAVRFRAYNNYQNGWIFENSSENMWLGLRASDGFLVHYGNIYQATGYIGVGTSIPYCPLHIATGGGGINQSYSGYWNYNTGLSFSNYTHYTMSIYGLFNICTNAAFVASLGTLNSSDRRIKENIQDIEDASALETLRLIKPKTYNYKDRVKSGDDTVYGFIAQEVREVLPHATALMKEYIPNIYELATVSSSNVLTFTNFNTNELTNTVPFKIRLKCRDTKDHDVTVIEVIDEHSIRTEENIDEEWTGVLDENSNLISGNQLFVYGEEVDDFVFLKKESIFTVATAALQEVDRQQQADKARIAELETQLASVLARLDALENPPS